MRAAVARAATPEFLHDAWTTENGLPQNDVQVVQTRDGYLWLGTNGGLVRFDGVRFTVFDAGNTPGLRSNRVLTLCEDEAGDLWIGTQSGGLTRYSRGTFTNYTTADGLPDEQVFDLAAARGGALWASTPKGLVRLAGGRFDIYTTRDGLPDNKAFILDVAPDGTVWLAVDAGVVRFQEGRFTNYPRADGLPTDALRNLTSARVAGDGSLWLVTKYGLARLADGRFELLAPRPAKGSREPAGDSVVYVFEGRDGAPRLLTTEGVGRYEDGRVLLDARFRGLEPLARRGTIKSCIEDREGNVWLGTGGKGLHRFKSRQVTAYTADEGLSNLGFIPVVGDGEGNLWLGSVGLFHFRGGVFTPYPFGDAVRSLYLDHAGTLWIGTEGRGLYRLAGGRLLKDHPLNAVLGGAAVAAIKEDREGGLWVGAGGDEGQVGGLYRYRDGQTTRYGRGDGLASDDVRFIMQDSAGALWVGTTGGLSRFHGGRFTNYTTAQGLSNDYVRDVYEDASGTLWVGTYGGGLNRVRDGRFVAITTREGLFDNIVSRILEDDRGDFWISCNRGIYRVSRSGLNEVADGRAAFVTSIPYGVSDGMSTNETNGGGQPAGWKTPDGQLWFPTIRGVVRVDPSNLNMLPPPVHIEQVLIGRRPVGALRPVEVRPGQGDLEIHYTGLSFTAPEKVRFKYKLEGYDRDWVDARDRRVAYYTNIAPGSYTFRVMAANNDGVWGARPATIPIVVIPPFWRTWWFVSVCAAALAAAALILYRRRVGKLERARATQEAFSRQLIESQESERKRIAAELHDSLGQELLIIKNRAALGLRLLRDDERAREQIEQIAGTASQAITEVRQIAYNLRPYHLDEIGLSQALEELVERFANACPITFAGEVDNIDDLLSKEAAINLYRIVQESLNNVVKHSGASEARLFVRRRAREIEVVVEDNGKGFAEANGASRREGFGLTGLAERARILGGTLSISSQPGRGATVRLNLRVR